MTTQNRHSLHCILPPHILEKIAGNGTQAQRDKALQTLAVDVSARQHRLITSMRPVEPKAPQATATKRRHIYDAGHDTNLPGTSKRAEGDGPTGDVAVDEAYDGMGSTWDLYADVFDRNSWDDEGGELIGTVHFDNDYDNAFWNGEQMVYGDGDGELFNRFTIAIDVIGHELTHGVTGDESELRYEGQSGALNESLSDVFGSLVKQYAAAPQETADVADWLIGEGLFTAAVTGVALRSMAAPGTAYDDDVLGKDPQPAHMDDFVVTAGDNGGVHINSGIPNHAFYLLATALGGYAWERAGKIWYAACTDDALSPDANFQEFADLTVEHAGSLFGETEREATRAAWDQVGITVQADSRQLTP